MKLKTCLYFEQNGVAETATREVVQKCNQCAKIVKPVAGNTERENLAR